jgi:hypothetical protein
MKNVFAPEITAEIIQRIEQLTPSTQAEWGTMNVEKCWLIAM